MDKELIFHHEMKLPDKAVKINPALIHPTILEGFIKRHCNRDIIFALNSYLYCPHPRKNNAIQTYCRAGIMDY